MRGARFTGRSGAGGMKDDGACCSTGVSATGSGNSDGFGCIGRMVTSSSAVIGCSAAATAALAAVSIPAEAGAGLWTGAWIGCGCIATRVSLRSIRSAGRGWSPRSFCVSSASRASGAFDGRCCNEA